MVVPKVLRHFEQADPKLYALLVQADLKPLINLYDTNASHYAQLTKEIIAQQLATKAARAITERFVLLLDNEVTPEKVLGLSDETLRAVGLSRAKVRYIKDLAAKTQSGQVQFEQLPSLPDEEVIEHLIQVKGIGRWTAEMFLIFTLGREDVFSLGDLGLKRALQKQYLLEDSPDFQKQVEVISQPWRPYRSYACLALWRSLDTAIT